MKAVVSFLVLSCFVAVCQADVLIGWDVNGVDVAAGTGVDDSASGYARLPASSAPNIQEGKLCLGFDAPSVSSDLYGVRYADIPHQTSLADAVSSDHYIQFDLKAAPGFRFDLSSIKMNGASGSSGPDSIALMANVTGFNAGDEIVSLAGRQGVTGGWDTDESGWGDLIDLTGADFQDLTSVTFRLYMWGSTGSASSGIRDLSGNDLVINGTMEAIPEPTVMSLISLFGIGGLAVRRLRR